jgi:hypothetical protein
MTQPNLIIEGKGQNIYHRVISKSTSDGLKSTKRQYIDDRKTAVKLIAESGSVSFWITVTNDDFNTTDTYDLTFIPCTKTGWTIVMNVDGSPQSSGYDLPVLGGARHQIEIQITAPASLEPGETAYVLLRAMPSTETNPEYVSDMVKCAVVCPIVTLTDVETEYEQLYEDTILFPTGDTYDNQQVVQSYIDKHTEFVGNELSRKINGIQIDDYNLCRAYILNRVKYEIYWRAVEFSIDGGVQYAMTLRQIVDEGYRIYARLISGGP